MAKSDPGTFGMTEGLRQELSDLQQDVAHASGEIAQDLARAVVEGQELKGLLETLVLQQADRTMNSAVNSAFDLVGQLGEGLVGAAIGGGASAMGNIFNVNVAAPTPTAFRGSETQMAASLSRAVARGQRGL